MRKNSRLVYSTTTESGAGALTTPVDHDGAQAVDARQGDGMVSIHRHTKGRKGSGVSIIKGLSMDEKSLKALARQLKQKLGVGGSIKEGHIELQTSRRQQIKEHLESQGYSAKIAGG